jgi:hypothetical protein
MLYHPVEGRGKDERRNTKPRTEREEKKEKKKRRNKIMRIKERGMCDRYNSLIISND